MVASIVARRWLGADVVETLEQLVAIVVTAGLVAGNFLLFTPWRDGVDPRERDDQRVSRFSVSIHTQMANSVPMGSVITNSCSRMNC